MTYGGPGPNHPRQPAWQQQPPGPQPPGMPPQGVPPQGMPPRGMPPQGRPYPPRHVPGETPLTLPGWGAVPALLGVALAAIGLFALKWAGDATFADLNESIRHAAGTTADLTGNGRWIKIYFPQGVIIALALAAVPPALWSLGSLRSAKSVQRRGGLMKKSLREGRTGPTRAVISVLAGLCLLYHVISLLILTDGGEYLGKLGPGPWLLVAGTALSVAGAVIGPRVPRHPATGGR
ncbi:hypothetical protein [Amycolatopsis sp. NPDC059021]|uniref:hypothetical protein n=1 Tax=Amycolatopsis sp. NPDC059021 TaxID=3346704 RepID=UPI003671FDFC